MLTALLIAFTSQMEPPGLIGHAAVRVGSSVFVVGGWCDKPRGNSDLTWRYDLSAKTWSQSTRMPNARVFIGAAILQGKVYVTGGIDPDSVQSNRIDVYDPAKDRWESGTALPEAKTRHCLVAWKGYLYAIGGFNGKTDRRATNSARVDRFDPHAKKWQAMPELNVARHGSGVAILHGRIFVVGGFGATDGAGKIVESWAPGETKWRIEPGLPEEKGFLEVASYKDQLFAIGGGRYSHSVLRFDGKTWQACSGTSWPSRRSASVQIGEQLLVFGGEPDQKPFLKSILLSDYLKP